VRNESLLAFNGDMFRWHSVLALLSGHDVISKPFAPLGVHDIEFVIIRVHTFQDFRKLQLGNCCSAFIDSGSVTAEYKRHVM
jgi:hypothetical protein